MLEVLLPNGVELAIRREAYLNGARNVKRVILLRGDGDLLDGIARGNFEGLRPLRRRFDAEQDVGNLQVGLEAGFVGQERQGEVVGKNRRTQEEASLACPPAD